MTTTDADSVAIANEREITRRIFRQVIGLYTPRSHVQYTVRLIDKLARV